MAAFLMKEVRYVIIYISSKENEGLLDRMAEQHEWDLLAEVMEKGSLNTFIPERLQIIQDLQYMVIERSCIRDNSQQLKDMMETTRTMWDTQFVLLEEELPQDDEGEYQKVIYEDHITILYKYQDNLESSLEYLLKGEKIPIEDIYNGTWIGVMSSNSGAGATHVSIGLANFIHQYTESICYVEANESGDLAAMADFYGFEKIEDNHYRRDGMDYRHMDIDQEKRFVILDMGKYSTAKLNLFNQCKVKILVTDGKPYRMADALNVLRYIKDEDTKLWLNFSNSKEYEKIKEEYLIDMNNAAGCLAWHENMFKDTDILYQEALRAYINVSQAKQSKISFILNPDKLKGRGKHSFRTVKSKDKKQVIDKHAEQSVDLEEPGIREQEEVAAGHEEMGLQEEEFPIAVSEEPEDISFQSIAIEPDADQDPDAEEETLPDYSENAKDTEQKETVQEGIPEVKKRVPVKNNLVLFLAIGAAIWGTLSLVPQLKQVVPDFHFNNPDTEQAAELVDDDLNINPDIKISVLEVEGADGYEVSYSTDKDFDKKTTVVVEVETADKAVESLTAGKTYYVRVRAFKFNEDGTKIYGEYTEVEKIET